MTAGVRFDHVGITVRDLPAVRAFFELLGLEADDEPRTAEGQWLEDVIGIDGARVDVVTLRAPGDGPGVELSQFRVPEDAREPRAAPPDELGLRSVAFEVHDLDASLSRVQRAGYELVRTVGTYDDAIRLCYVRGPEQVIVMLAQQIRS